MALFDASILQHASEFTDFIMRPLHRNDHENGYAKLLSQLTDVGDLNARVFEVRFDSWLEKTPNTYFVVVIERPIDHQLVASGTLFIERKMIHTGGLVGHVEDIVVCESERGKQLGKRLIDGLMHIAQHYHCYKVILDCQESKCGFYAKCGFQTRGYQMAWYQHGHAITPGANFLSQVGNVHRRSSVANAITDASPQLQGAAHALSQK